MDNHHNPKIHLNIFWSSQSNSSCPVSSFDTMVLMFMHSVPLQSPQEATHFSPFAWQENLEFSPHGFLDQILQLHLITFKMSLVTGSSSLIIGTNLLFSSFQPQYSVLELQNLNCSVHEVGDTHARNENGQLFSLVGVLLVLSWLNLHI